MSSGRRIASQKLLTFRKWYLFHVFEWIIVSYEGDKKSSWFIQTFFLRNSVFSLQCDVFPFFCWELPFLPFFSRKGRLVPPSINFHHEWRRVSSKSHEWWKLIRGSVILKDARVKGGSNTITTVTSPKNPILKTNAALPGCIGNYIPVSIKRQK